MAKKKTARDTRAEKKSQVLGAGKKKNRLPLILVAAAAITAAAAVFLLQSPDAGRQAALEAGVSSPDAGAVTFPTALFADGRARHYEFSRDGLTVRYFIVKSSDGVIRAAFDACDVCWRADKGYEQDGDVMVCRNCGRRFASALVNEVQGGCNPAPLRRSVEGDRVVIHVDDILQGRAYFNFS